MMFKSKPVPLRQSDWEILRDTRLSFTSQSSRRPVHDTRWKLLGGFNDEERFHGASEVGLIIIVIVIEHHFGSSPLILRGHLGRDERLRDGAAEIDGIIVMWAWRSG